MSNGRRRQPRSIDKLRAWRLAQADVYYALDSHITNSLLSIEDKDAARIRRSKDYQENLQRLTESLEAHNRNLYAKDAEKLRIALSSMVPKAVEVLYSNLNSDDENVRLRAAQEVLDRDGRMPKVSKVQNTVDDKSVLPEPEQSIIDEFHKNMVN